MQIWPKFEIIFLNFVNWWQFATAIVFQEIQNALCPWMRDISREFGGYISNKWINCVYSCHFTRSSLNRQNWSKTRWWKRFQPLDVKMSCVRASGYIYRRGMQCFKLVKGAELWRQVLSLIQVPFADHKYYSLWKHDVRYYYLIFSDDWIYHQKEMKYEFPIVMKSG